ncbi:hypothetical protein [Roseateles terrae]|uniref:DUF2169 domain-containing protein n=1 Tax=Roseateles terrae TaxID=431060 RepID=A0ABR6GM61_9BURK|nr:hypothetical protein [Roseateles terrae]MBB3193200.1 hypothetical protein [Roseateles terrae]OWQ89582.1 hypothetical protein CDN98_03395 [Roseateles terrae]
MSRTLPLFRLEVAHAYFADGRARGLRWEAADDTARRLRRADVLERQDGASLTLLGPADAAVQLLHDSGEPLTWWVRATDPAFAIYTDDPAQRPNELLVVAPPAGFPDSSSEPATAHSVASVRVMPIVHGPTGAPDPVPEGSYALSGEAAWRAPFAVLRLPPDALATPDATPGVSTRPPGPATLRWSLLPRRVIWKYCLFGDWSEDALDIVDPDGTVSFFPPAAERGPEGRPLLAMRSRVPLALAERSDTRLQLRCRQSGVSKVLVKRLPVPGPRHLAREEIDGAATLVSEIHVHR